jgi:hypothetical protein
MSRRQEKRLLRHVHRALIALLTLLGVLLDGLQPADLPLQAAAVIWLWSPELQALEDGLVRRLRRRTHTA